MRAALAALYHACVDWWWPLRWSIAGCWLLYVASMCMYRCAFERKVRVRVMRVQGWEAHEKAVASVVAQFRGFLAARAPGQKVTLQRSRAGEADSNRTQGQAYKSNTLRVNVSELDGVIALDRANRLIHVQPGLAQDMLARFCIAHGMLPTLVLEFPGITVGGAICGGGIESTSHAVGCFADTVEAFDILTGDGRLLRGVSRTNHPDLFYGIRTSFGTLGLLLAVTLRLDPAPRYVHVSYVHADSPRAGLDVLAAASSHAKAKTDAAQRAGKDEPLAFIDGVALSQKSAVAVIGAGCDVPPPGVPALSLRGARSDPWFFWHLSDIAARAPARSAKALIKRDGSITGCAEEFMSLEDYLFRFDRGAFWMARHGLRLFYGRHAYRDPAGAGPGVTAGPSCLIRCKYSWLATTRQLYRMLHKVGDETLSRVYVIQDLIMPSAAAAAKFIEQTTAVEPVGIWPLWLCPVRAVEARHPADAGFGFPSQAPSRVGDVWMNVGVYGEPAGGEAFDPLLVNRRIEDATMAGGGRKMLYAQSFYTQQSFWKQFDQAAYERVRAAYANGNEIFPSIATKALLGEARLSKLGGTARASILSAWKPMVWWYSTLWLEILLPRWAHSALGIENTGMCDFEPADAVEKKAAEGGARYEPADPSPATESRPPRRANSAHKGKKDK